MNGVLSFISNYGVYCINFIGIVVLLLILRNYFKLILQKGRIVEVLNRKTTKTNYDGRTGEIDEEEIQETTTPDTVRSYEKDFNKACSWYQVWVQFVPLFPLFGILGTVAGLMLQVNAQDIDNITGSLGTALSTTFWGLIWAIGLKVVVAVCPARIIYDVEVMLEDYHKKFTNKVNTATLNNLLEN